MCGACCCESSVAVLPAVPGRPFCATMGTGGTAVMLLEVADGGRRGVGWALLKLAAEDEDAAPAPLVAAVALKAAMSLS